MSIDEPSGAELEGVDIQVLDPIVIDEMVGKIRALAAAPGTAEAVAAWREVNGHERWEEIGHDQVVVGTTLMYLHDAPDGTLIPHERTADGVERIYTDQLHLDSLF
jgi:hypothetical protein